MPRLTSITQQALLGITISRIRAFIAGQGNLISIETVADASNNIEFLTQGENLEFEELDGVSLLLTRSNGTILAIVADLTAPGGITAPQDQGNGTFLYRYEISDYPGRENWDSAEIVPTPEYTLTPAAFDVDEGSNLLVTITTTSVLDGTTVYWDVNPLVDTFVENNGSVTISGGSATFILTPNVDYTTESEGTRLLLRDAPLTGNIIAQTANITINDVYQNTLTYATFINTNEGQSTGWTVTGVEIGETYWYDIVPDGDDDFTADDVNTPLSGSYVATDNGAGEGRVSINFRATEDLLTEGSEAARINLRSMSSTGPIIASVLWRINDSSRTQLAVITPATTSIAQGDTLEFTIDPANFPTGYQATWRIVNGTTDSADFAAGRQVGFGDNYNTGTQSATWNVGFNGVANFELDIAANSDFVNETFQIEVLNEANDRAGISPVITITGDPFTNTMIDIPDSTGIFYSAFPGQTGGLLFDGSQPTSQTNDTYYTLGGRMRYPCTIEAFVKVDDSNSGFFELQFGFNPFIAFYNDGVWATNNFSANGRLYGLPNDGTVGPGGDSFIGLVMHEQAGSNGQTCDRITVINSFFGAREHTLDDPINTLDQFRLGEMQTRSVNGGPGSDVTYKMNGEIQCVHITNREKYTTSFNEEFGILVLNEPTPFTAESIVKDDDTILWIPDQDYYNDLTYTENLAAPGFGRASFITGTTDPTVTMPSGFGLARINTSVTYEAFVYHTTQPDSDTPYLAIRNADGTSFAEIRGNGQIYIQSPAGTIISGGIAYTWPLPNEQWNHIVFVTKRWGNSGDVGFALAVNGTVVAVNENDFAEIQGMERDIDKLSWRSQAFDTVHSGINLDFIRVKGIDEYDLFGAGQGGTYTVPTFGNPPGGLGMAFYP